MDDMIYDGQLIHWKGLQYPASSGLPWRYYYKESRSSTVASLPMSARNRRCQRVGSACAIRISSSGNRTVVKTRQHPDFQDAPDGPVPEGRWKLAPWLGTKAEDDGTGTCALRPSWRLEQIPRGDAETKGGKSCDPFRENWGGNRIRIEPADGSTQARLSRNGRDGFYIHDSTKGFSHGCIEVDRRFFTELYKHYKNGKVDKRLILTIDYVERRWTYGGTRK